MKVLVKKEAELGEYGKASVEVNSGGEIVFTAQAKVDLIAELEKLAAKTGTPVDDQVVSYIKGLVQAANAIAG